MRLFLVFSFFFSTLFAAEKTDLLFVGFDAGESNIWIQLLQSWDQAPSYQVLTMATATKVVKDASLKQIACPSPTHRLEELSPKELQKFSAYSADILITGMYSSAQRQIAEEFAKKGTQIIAVWDNFSTFDKLPKELVANVQSIIAHSHCVLVPSTEIATDLNQRFSTDKVRALGQPTLESWKEKIAQVDRQKALAKLELKEDLPIITYVGGYEEKGNGYEQAFLLFAQALHIVGEKIQVIVQLHPRSNGSFEESVLADCAHKNPNYPTYRIANGKNASTLETVALCDLGVCHRSTVAIQALFAGKHFLHIDLPDTAFSHFAIDKGLVAQCTDAKSAAAYMRSHLQSAGFDETALCEQSGIVPNATEAYRQFLLDAL